MEKKLFMFSIGESKEDKIRAINKEEAIDGIIKMGAISTNYRGITREDIAIREKFQSHQCQHCGSESKRVETLIDDEFTWDEDQKEYIAQGFSDDFSHTGNEKCKEC